MTAKRSLLEDMEDRPLGNWSISDVATLCEQIGVNLKAPTRGSHYKVSSDFVHGVVVVPHRRPIKPVYIRKLTSFARAHLEFQAAQKGPK